MIQTSEVYQLIPPNNVSLRDVPLVDQLSSFSDITDRLPFGADELDRSVFEFECQLIFHRCKNRSAQK